MDEITKRLAHLEFLAGKLLADLPPMARIAAPAMVAKAEALADEITRLKEDSKDL